MKYSKTGLPETMIQDIPERTRPDPGPGFFDGHQFNPKRIDFAGLVKEVEIRPGELAGDPVQATPALVCDHGRERSVVR